MPKLTIDLEMQLAKFQDSLNKVQRDVNKAGKNLQSAFAGIKGTLATLGVGLGIGALVGVLRNVAEEADNIGKAAQKVGITTEALSALRHAADLSDVSFEALTTGLVRLSKNMSDTAQGTGDAKDAFAALKINVERVGGGLKGTDEILAELADKFAEMEDGAGKTALAVKIFGRAGADLIPLLNAGSSGLADMRAEAERLGIIIDSKTAKAAEEFNDNMTRLSRTLDGMKISVFAPIIEQLATLTTEMLEAAKAADSLGASFAAMAGVLQARIFEGFGESIEQQISGVEQQIARIQKRQEIFSKGFLGGAILGPETTIGGLGLKQANEELKDAQANLKILQGLAAKDRGELESGLSFSPPKAKKKAPPIVDIKKTIDEAKKAADALASLEAARAKSAVSSEQKLAQIRLDLLDRFHNEGLISEQDYWDRRLEIQRAAVEASIQAVEKEISLREDRLSKTKKGTADYFNELKDLEDAQKRRNELEQDFALVSTKNYLDASKAAEAYADDVAQVASELARLKGQEDVALALDIERRDRLLRQRALSAGDEGALRLLEQRRDAQLAEAEFNRERQRGQDIIRNLAAAEERIQNARRVGAKTELESLAETSEERQKAVAQLEAMSANLRDIATRSGLPELTRQADEFQLQMENIAASSDLLAEKFDSIAERGLGDLFNDIISGSKSASEAFQDFGKTIVDEVNKIIAQELARKLQQAIFGELFGGKSGGSLLSSLLGGTLFGGGGGGQISANLGAELIGQGVFAMQHGGLFKVGGFGGVDSQLVAFRATPGERVQVTPPGKSTIGNVVNISVNVPPSTSSESAGQMGSAIGAVTARYLRRNG